MERKKPAISIRNCSVFSTDTFMAASATASFWMALPNSPSVA
jgi:hypothetical protein